MGRLLLVGVLVAGSVLGAVGLGVAALTPDPAPVYAPPPPPPDPADTARWDVLKTVATGTLVAGMLGAVVFGAVWVGARARRAVLESDLFYPNAQGIYGLERGALADPNLSVVTAAAWHRTQYRAARSAQLPIGHYHNEVHPAPYDYTDPPPDDGAPQLEAPDVPMPDVPPLLQLWQQGLLSRPDALIGYNQAGAPVFMPTPVDMLIVGKKGSGKTTAARYLALLTALRGGRIILCDPHMGANDESLGTSLEDLAPFYALPPAKTPDEVLAALRWVQQEMDRRLHGGAYTDDLTVFIDEVASICNPAKAAWVPVAKELIPLTEDVNVEARKVRIRVVAMTQQPNASRLGGGSEFKNSFSGTLVMRVAPQQSTMLPLLPRERPLAARLPKGAGFYLDDDGGSTLLRTPNATREDVRMLVQQVTGAWGGPRVISVDSVATAPDPKPNEADVAPVATPPAPPSEGQKAAALWLHGYTWAEVVKDLRGVASSQGGSYQKALTELQAAARQAVQDAGGHIPAEWGQP